MKTKNIEFDSPVFLIGTHRSGTTWLGHLLGQSDEFAYWTEPRQVWSYRNWNKPNDVLLASDVTEKIKRHIRKRFDGFTRKPGATRFCEKTPSNCLRIPFMYEIFPEGKYILLIRDGRAVFRSTDEIQSKGADWSRIWGRLTESSWNELPAHFDRMHWIARKLMGHRLNFWGVRPPGWKEWPEKFSPEEVIAMQWTQAISTARHSFSQLPAENTLIVRYESLLENTMQEMQRIGEFARIHDVEKLVSAATKSVTRNSSTKWRDELSAETLERIKPIMLPKLLELGYSW